MLKEFGVRKSATDLWDWLVDNYDEFIQKLNIIKDLVNDATGKDYSDLFEDFCDALEKLKEASREEAENHKETIHTAACDLYNDCFMETGVTGVINSQPKQTRAAGGMVEHIVTIE